MRDRVAHAGLHWLKVTGASFSLSACAAPLHTPQSVSEGTGVRISVSEGTGSQQEQRAAEARLCAQQDQPVCRVRAAEADASTYWHREGAVGG